MKVELTVPRSYAELDEKQLRYIAQLQLSEATTQDVCTKCFIRFSGIKPVAHINEIYFFVKKKLKGFFSMTADEVAFFSKKMNWITNSFIGIQPIKIGRYRPCDKWMRDTAFLQYIDAENYYQAYIHTKEDQYIHKLMAVMYQPGSRYSNSIVPKLAKYFRKRTDVEKHIVLMWMVGLKSYYARKFKHLFAGVSIDDEDDETTFPDMAEIINNQLRMLTAGDVTKRKQVLTANTIDALSELDDKCREYQQLKAKM